MKIGLLGRILIAIALGIALGHVFTLPWVRIFATFNSIFGQFLGFIIPLIILGLVTPAIADIGKGAGKLLLITVGIAYADTVVAAILSYTAGSTFFPSLIGNGSQTLETVEKSAEILPYFTINIPATIDVMSALVLSFIVGLGIAYSGHTVLRGATNEMKAIIVGVIERVIIPLLPVYIFGIFLNMTFSGDVMRMMTVFAKIIVDIFALPIGQHVSSLSHGPGHLFVGSHHTCGLKADTQKRRFRRCCRLCYPPLRHCPPFGFGHEDNRLRLYHRPTRRLAHRFSPLLAFHYGAGHLHGSRSWRSRWCHYGLACPFGQHPWLWRERASTDDCPLHCYG